MSGFGQILLFIAMLRAMDILIPPHPTWPSVILTGVVAIILIIVESIWESR